MPSSYIGLKAIERHALSVLREGVDEAADLFEHTAAGLAPELTGTLAGGIENQGARPVSATAVEAKVQTGPAADEYAVIQHQRRKGIKYMQIPLLGSRGILVARLAAAARRRF
jgi:hypothetical protein